MGVPTVTLATRPFEKLSRATARARGVPDLPIIVLPFPYDQLPSAEIRELARRQIDAMLEGIAPREAHKGIEQESSARA
jgi:hypothetical protein